VHLSLLVANLLVYKRKFCLEKLLEDEISFVGCDGHVDRRKTPSVRARMSLDGRPNRVLQQLREDVVERHFDVGKPGADVAGNPDVRCVSVLVLGQVLDEGGPAFDEGLRAHGYVDDSDVIVVLQIKQTNLLSLEVNNFSMTKI
jgi:hypothetical protein